MGSASRSGLNTMPSRRYWVTVLSGDANATSCGDDGQPVVDVLGVFDDGPGLGWPEIGRCGSRATVDEKGAVADLVEADGAAAGQGVVEGQGTVTRCSSAIR
jgi:hypothetical protein